MIYKNTNTNYSGVSSQTSKMLSEQQIADFNTNGYIILPSLLTSDLVDKIVSEVDVWVDNGLRQKSIAKARSTTPPAIMEMDLEEHGKLISHPPMMSILEELMGPVFAFHHLHSDRHQPGTSPKHWHHDYEQHPQTNRSHTMIHIFYYLNGLSGNVGDLVLLPGSHQFVMNKKALSHFGDASLPNEVVIDHLPPGSALVLHSALLHTRRAKQSNGLNTPRYFIDCSYCQGGIRWPQVKTYWRHMLAKGRELGLDRGRWPELFNEKHFYSPFEAVPQFSTINQGSLMEKLVEPQLLEA